MSEWDFLHDMSENGYSAEEISDAAAVGYAPGQFTDGKDDAVMDSELERQLTLSALDSLERIRQSRGITRAQYLECKAAILK